MSETFLKVWGFGGPVKHRCNWPKSMVVKTPWRTVWLAVVDKLGSNPIRLANNALLWIVVVFLEDVYRRVRPLRFDPVRLSLELFFFDMSFLNPCHFANACAGVQPQCLSFTFSF
jgi:hypothetical protein